MHPANSSESDICSLSFNEKITHFLARVTSGNLKVVFLFQIFLSTPNAGVAVCLEHETHIKIVAMIYNFTIKTYKYIFDHIVSA